MSPDGKYLLPAGFAGVARMYYANLVDAVRDLCGRLLRDFTDEERTAYDITDTTPTCPNK